MAFGYRHTGRRAVGTVTAVNSLSCIAVSILPATLPLPLRRFEQAVFKPGGEKVHTFASRLTYRIERWRAVADIVVGALLERDVGVGRERRQIA